MKRFVVPSLIFLALLGFAVSLLIDSVKDQWSVSVVGETSPLEHPLIANGNPVLINFWFSTCAPCRAEHPTLMELAKSNVAILGINRDIVTEDASRFLDELGNPYHSVVYDPADDISAKFGIIGWPSSVLVAGNGIIQAIYGPLIDPSSKADMRLISEPETLFDDPGIEAHAQAIFALINCLDCDANTIRESGGDFALQMRKLVRAWIETGLTEVQIRDLLIERYGQKIWLDPPLSFGVAFLYLIPVVVFGFGIAALTRSGRR